MTDSLNLAALSADLAVSASAETAPETTSVAAPVAAQDAVTEPNATEPNGFERLGLSPELLAAVTDLGFTQPTQVQEKAIPLAMQDGNAGRYNDLMVSSQTGSGKTAAFLLPVLHTLLQQQQALAQKDADEWAATAAAAAANGEAAPKRPRRKDPTNPRNFKAAVPGALVLCPTRELAQQVAHDAIELVKHCRGLRIANVVGGIPYQIQIAKLQNANLVVATPGRLLDLQRSMQIKLDQVQFLVVDEADRMLDLGFSDDLAEINQLTINRHQTMMFSATFAPRIQQLAARVMREPQRIEIATPQQKHRNIRQVLHWADNASHKRRMLDHLLRDTTIDQAIVFASTQVECDGLANDLQQDGFSAVALHGALSQGLRNRRLMALRQGQVQILVATDVAARGIDVPTITHVFNYGLPMKSEDYTHRIGRTGRAGRDGLAVTLAEFRDKRKIFDIEAYTHQTFNADVIPGLEPTQRLERGRGDFGGRRDGRGDGRRRQGNGDRRFGDNRFGDNRSGDSRFGDNRFGDNRFGDNRFGDNRSGEGRFNEGRFNDGRSGEGRFGDSRFGGDRRAGDGRFGDNRSGDGRSGGQPFHKAHGDFASKKKPSGPRMVGGGFDGARASHGGKPGHGGDAKRRDKARPQR